MKNARHEKPQKGNPHDLTINQHVLPAASIARFAGGDRRVDLCDTLRGINRRALPADEIFCARRAWTNREERGFMKSIEDAFQGLARNIIDGTVSSIGDAEKATVNAFFSLWKWRADRRSLPEQEIQAKMVTGVPRTRDEEEALEKAGILFIREGGTIPARQINGVQLYHLVYRAQ